MIYRNKWQKRWPQALITYFRDLLIFALPFRLPLLIRKALFGFDPEFVFLVHPRRKADIFIALPFLRPLRAILPKSLRYRVIESIPPLILGKVRTARGANGLIVSTTKLPATLLGDRKKSLFEARKCVRFSSKISKKDAYLGLGGWWPMVTRRGMAVGAYAKARQLQVTNGHTGTLCSLVMMTERIARLGDVPLNQMDVLVLGVGKMGMGVVRALYGRVRTIMIYDLNLEKARRVAADSKNWPACQTSVVHIEGTGISLRDAMSKSHEVICVTSNFNKLAQHEQLPSDTIVLDDSRPEAFARHIDRRRRIVVLEGGLLKIDGAMVDYDFGFGKNGDVFGCLAEAYILASDRSKALTVTIGSVDEVNYKKMYSYLDRLGVSVGDFRCSNLRVEDSLIRRIMAAKKEVHSPA